MTLLKEAEYKGNKYKFYEVEDASEILHERHIMGQVADMYIRFGLSRDFLKGMASMLKKASRSADSIEDLQDTCTKIAFNIEERLGLIAETKQYEELACIYSRVEINGEMEPEDFVESWQEKKKIVWNANKKLRDFFLSKAVKRSHELSNMSQKDILHVLKLAEQRVNQLPTLVSSLATS